MKRNWLVALVLMLVLSLTLTGCGQNSTDDAETEEVEEESTEIVEETEEAEEEEAEEVVEDSEDTAEDTDTASDDLAWPERFMADVPVFEGEIHKVTEKETDNHFYVGFENVDYDEAVAYVETLKLAGFTKDSNGYDSETTVNYKANGPDGNFVKFHWGQNGFAGIDMIKD